MKYDRLAVMIHKVIYNIGGGQSSMTAKPDLLFMGKPPNLIIGAFLTKKADSGTAFSLDKLTKSLSEHHSSSTTTAAGLP